MKSPYDIVEELEKRVAEYAGAPYAVAVDSCTNALLIALTYLKWKGEAPAVVELPCKTYVGVAYACLNAGYKIKFRDYQWSGAYRIGGTNIVDSARRFTSGMYEPGTLWCLSAHWSKILKIGRGGFILTDDAAAVPILKRMRFDGRGAGVPPIEDDFYTPGFHAYQLPEEASRGLMLMASMPEFNLDIPADGYADLSKYPVFQGGVK